MSPSRDIYIFINFKNGKLRNASILYKMLTIITSFYLAVVVVGCKLSVMSDMVASPSQDRHKAYDYVLKFLLVGDSDVGKEEILNGLQDDASEIESATYGGHLEGKL